MPEPRRPFWTVNKVYWLLYIVPLTAWFLMDGTKMFFFEPDVKHPERVWFKLGVYLLLVNVITMMVFAEDKRRAQRDDWRISENTLVYLVTLGGLPGALLAMRMFHHKTLSLWLQARMFGWFGLEAAFTFLVLPHSYSYANDARWGICLFSLFWWNLEVARGILRYYRKRGREQARYLAVALGSTAVLLAVSLGGLYLFDRMGGDKPDGWRYARVGVIAAGVLLVLVNEVTLTVRGIRGKLPGWDPIPPPGKAA